MSSRKKHVAPALADQLHITLTVEELTFVTELVKHGNCSRASAAAGWHPDTGYRKREDPRIQQLMSEARKQAFDRSVLDIEWMMDEAEDLYRMAKIDGDIKAGISALGLIGKLAPVDAFAASKVEVGLGDKIARLKQGRLRAAHREPDAGDDDISFM